MKKLMLLMAAIALVCFSVPAMAVDWNFYGNARMATFYESRDFGDGENDAGTDDEDAETIWDIQANSRIGATIKAENINARFEFGVGGFRDGNNVSSRRIFGEWNFGVGKLKIGKDYTPVSQFVSGQVFDADLGLLGIGAFYGSRFGQVAFSFGNFEVALVADNANLIEGLKETEDAVIGTFGAAFGDVSIVTDANGDVDSVIPKVELGWGMSFDAWNFNLMGGFQYFEIEDVQPLDTSKNEDDISVWSWVIGGDLGLNFGPAYFRGAVSYGQNIGDAGWSIPGGVNGRSGTYQGGLAVWDGDDDVNDTYTFQAALVGGLKFSDRLSFEAGFGYRNDRTDEGEGDLGQFDTSPWALYLQSVIALAPGVYVIPEVGYYDLDDEAKDSEDAGSLFYIGGKWQINF